MVFTSKSRVKDAVVVAVLQWGGPKLTHPMANARLEFGGGFAREGDGHDFGRQQPGPFAQLGALPLGCSKGTMTGQRGSWPCWRDEGRTLVGGEQVLDIAFGHHGRLAGSGSSVQRNVAIEVQPEPLTGVEMNHQTPPPFRVDAPQDVAMAQ